MLKWKCCVCLSLLISLSKFLGKMPMIYQGQHDTSTSATSLKYFIHFGKDLCAVLGLIVPLVVFCNIYLSIRQYIDTFLMYYDTILWVLFHDTAVNVLTHKINKCRSSHMKILWIFTKVKILTFSLHMLSCIKYYC